MIVRLGLDGLQQEESRLETWWEKAADGSGYYMGLSMVEIEERLHEVRQQIEELKEEEPEEVGG